MDQRLKSLLERYRSKSASTTAERAEKDGLLDEIQEVAGFSGRMVTEADIIRRAEKLLHQE